MGDIIDAITDTGLFFPAVVAQLSVESDWGTSGLATSANNYGGIKGSSGSGSVLLDTTEMVNGVRVPHRAYFKKYSSFSDFMQDYVQLLTSGNYAASGALAAPTPEDQITKFVQAGYSTMTPKHYLKSGVGDRIKATQDQFPLLGRISSSPTASTITPSEVTPTVLDLIARSLSLPSFTGS